MTSPGLPAWARPALVGVLAFAVYLPSLANGFALDDVVAVEQDTRIQHLAGIPKLIGVPYLTHLPRERSPYRPLTTISYAVSWVMGGGHPGVFHATNIALHVAATLLVLSLLTTLGAPPVPAAIAAAIFAVHPVHVEAVAGIVGRGDLLSAIFMLLALRVHLAVDLKPAVRVLGISLAYLLALGAKEGAVVLPLLILVLEVMGPETRRPPGESGGVLRRVVSTWPTMAGMSVALAGFLLARNVVLGGVLHLDVAAYIAPLPTSLRVTTAIANLTEIARLLVFPLDLTPEYGPSVIMPAGTTDVRFWLGVATLSGFLALVGYGMRSSGLGRGDAECQGPSVGADTSAGQARLHHLRGRWLVAGLLWIGASYLLFSNLLLPLPMWIAERTLYLPSAGISILLVGVLSTVPAKRAGAQHAVHIMMIVVLLLAGVHTARHAPVWKNNETLFADLVERHPESFRAQWWLGGTMIEAGQLEEGLVWLETAFELNENSVLLRLDYVRALLLAGRSEEAEAIVRPIPIFLHPSRAVFLAQSLIFQDRTTEAAEAVRAGMEYFPDEPRLIEQARLLGIGG